MVQTRFANEVGCPEERVRIASLGAEGYRATGCDRTAVYVCSRNEICVRNSRIEHTVDRAVSFEEGDVDGRPGARLSLYAERGEIVLVVVPSLDREHTFVLSGGRSACDSIVFSAPGGPRIPLARERGMLRARLDALAVLRGAPGLELSACGVTRSLRPIELETLTRFLDAAARLAATEDPSTPSAAAAARAPTADGRLGVWLDAVVARQRDAILACAERGVVAVRVSAAGGQASWTLQGSPGTPEEECVRAVLAGEDAPPADGIAVRAVR